MILRFCNRRSWASKYGGWVFGSISSFLRFSFCVARMHLFGASSSVIICAAWKVTKTGMSGDGDKSMSGWLYARLLSC